MNTPHSKGPHHELLYTRRDFLSRAGAGFGTLALAWLLDEQGALAAAAAATDPLAAKKPNFPAKAKSVIFLFMEGGPSHLDLFDPKPKLNEWAGKPIPASFGKVVTSMGEFGSPLLGCKRTWKQYGQSGIWVSDWLPHLSECVDDLTVIRSCWADGINHSSGICQMNTGSILAGRPSLGAWVSYRLGTDNQNLPAFVVMQDTNATVVNGPRNWGEGFMPAVDQGTRFTAGTDPTSNLNAPDEIGDAQQRGKLDFLGSLNRSHPLSRAQQTELDARVA